jgi:hypothetical protein
MDTQISIDLFSNRPSANAVRAALEHLLASSELKLSERNRRFLAFVVSETLDGRAERIKAYSIGVDVFGRSANFDPSSDPIVRIEATRLRAALATYYSGVGARDTVRISMPPGSYIPTFEKVVSPTRASETGGGVSNENHGIPESAAILVKHHTDPRDRPASARSELLIESIIARLNDLGFSIFVMSPPERQAASNAIGNSLPGPDSLYQFDLAVHSLSDRRRYSWCITHLQSGRLKCTDSRDRIDKGVPGADMIDELAECAVKSVTKVVPLASR